MSPTKLLTLLLLSLPLQITFVDFVLYELLDQHRLFDASLIDGHDNIKVHKILVDT